MKLAIIGRGPWGNVYAKTLKRLDIRFEQAGRDWRDMPDCDGYIIASKSETHCEIATELIERGKPVLIEKPVCMASTDAIDLLRTGKKHGAIAFAGHTRLHDPNWRLFRDGLGPQIKRMVAKAGRKNGRDPWWDWGPHLVSLYLDILNNGHKIAYCDMQAYSHDTPFFIECDGVVYRDIPEDTRPLDNLVKAFVSAIKRGKPDYRGLEEAYRVTSIVESSIQNIEEIHGS